VDPDGIPAHHFSARGEFGRVGDIFGRVRMYTLGFAIFTVFSILLAVTWMTGPAAALWIISCALVKAWARIPLRQLERHHHRRLSPDERGLALVSTASPRSGARSSD